MEENQQTNLTAEPENNSDNSCSTEKTNPKSESDDGGKSAPVTGADPSNLILGKFKSQEDLINAYQQLEKLQGSQSSELGNLRQNAVWMKNIQQAWKERDELMNCAKELQSAAQKYNAPEYFQDPSFREMYKEAYLALGKNLDTDRFVNLIEGYVSSRLMKYQREESAKNETKSAIGGMNFDKNKNTELKPTGKRIDEMTEDEINEILDKYI